jgi:PAS domain S-box-containing protein
VRDNPIAIATLNLELRVVDCNPAFERLFGLSKKELFGKSLDDVILPEESEQEGRALSQAVLGGETVSQMTRRRLADGSLVDMQVFGMPVVLWGKQIGILAMYNDVTGLLQAQGVQGSGGNGGRTEEGGRRRAGGRFSRRAIYRGCQEETGCRGGQEKSYDRRRRGSRSRSRQTPDR